MPLLPGGNGGDIISVAAAPCAAKRVRSRSSGYVMAVATAPAVAPATSGMRACWNVVGVAVGVAWLGGFDG